MVGWGIYSNRKGPNNHEHDRKCSVSNTMGQEMGRNRQDLLPLGWLGKLAGNGMGGCEDFVFLGEVINSTHRWH